MHTLPNFTLPSYPASLLPQQTAAHPFSPFFPKRPHRQKKSETSTQSLFPFFNPPSAIGPPKAPFAPKSSHQETLLRARLQHRSHLQKSDLIPLGNQNPPIVDPLPPSREKLRIAHAELRVSISAPVYWGPRNGQNKKGKKTLSIVDHGTR